jgi:hypothetical protein
VWVAGAPGGVGNIPPYQALLVARLLAGEFLEYVFYIFGQLITASAFFLEDGVEGVAE